MALVDYAAEHLAALSSNSHLPLLTDVLVEGDQRSHNAPSSVIALTPDVLYQVSVSVTGEAVADGADLGDQPIGQGEDPDLFHVAVAASGLGHAGVGAGVLARRARVPPYPYPPVTASVRFLGFTVMVTLVRGWLSPLRVP